MIKKQLFFLLLLYFSVFNAVLAQETPAFVLHKLDSVKQRVKKSLIEYRYCDGDEILPCQLGYSVVFSYKETELIDSMGLNLSIGMLYDDEMRNRIVELLKDEYQQYEWDTLISRSMDRNLSFFKRQTFESSKIDTMRIFKNAMDSLYVSLTAKDSLNQFKKLNKIYDYEIFKFLQLDTLPIFKQMYRQVLERETKSFIAEALADPYHYVSSLEYLISLCGYINDKRFTAPLRELLNKPFYSTNSNHNSEWKQSIDKKILEALARMRVEPYYRDYIKKRTLTIEQIQDNKRLDFKLDDFVYVIGTQKAFLELSKYLLSNKPYTTVVYDYPDHAESRYFPVSLDALSLIQNIIINEDLQAIMKKGDSDDPKLMQQVYDWMKKNYGKYKIRIFWW